MKTAKNKIVLELHWHGHRSSVLGGYQAEINGNRLVIWYSHSGGVVWHQEVGWSKPYVRKKAAEIIRKLIQREL